MLIINLTLLKIELSQVLQHYIIFLMLLLLVGVGAIRVKLVHVGRHRGVTF